MNLNVLTAISPVDGRYRDKVAEYDVFFSEYGLIKYRILIEIEYFIALCDLPIPELKSFDKSKYDALRNIYINFSIDEAQAVKDTEKITNHDVKSVEYFIKDKFKALAIEEYSEFVHFGLTSQDINNTSIPLLLKESTEKIHIPFLESLILSLKKISDDGRNVSMLARTHGQPASPTVLGKEVYVFIERLEKQIQQLKQIVYSAKFGGATGNFNAHNVAYPTINWIDFANDFVNKRIGLDRSQTTTQIEHYDNLAAFFHVNIRINTILIDLCRDIWSYISMEYFGQKVAKNEVGSSAMPHKVNPIDFENAEGNLGIANAIFDHLALKLPVSRLQRDLTDSTVLRNIGVPLAHSLISYKSILKGLGKIFINENKIKSDLENNWSVVAEAIQTVLRSKKYPNPYEALKELTRTGEKVNKETMHKFIEGLKVDNELKAYLKTITPTNYTGIINY